MPSIGSLSKGIFRALHGMRELTGREKHRLVSEMSAVRGLLPLLMKPRNNQKWSLEDKAQLTLHLKRIFALSPYLMLLLMPCGFLVLPALAWWLDRRRLRERTPAAGA